MMAMRVEYAKAELADQWQTEARLEGSDGRERYACVQPVRKRRARAGDVEQVEGDAHPRMRGAQLGEPVAEVVEATAAPCNGNGNEYARFAARAQHLAAVVEAARVAERRGDGCRRHSHREM